MPPFEQTGFKCLHLTLFTPIKTVSIKTNNALCILVERTLHSTASLLADISEGV